MTFKESTDVVQNLNDEETVSEVDNLENKVVETLAENIIQGRQKGDI